jgi:hypothetical protein
MYKLIWILNAFEGRLITDYGELEATVKDIVSWVSIIPESANDELLNRLFITILTKSEKKIRWCEPVCMKNARENVFFDRRKIKR